MESMTTQLASFTFQNKTRENITGSSFPSPRRWKYDVFLSFRSYDTGMAFTERLYSDLKRKGILTFRDEFPELLYSDLTLEGIPASRDETLRLGKYYTAKLLRAIQKSIYAVVVISPRYAFSTFRLIELVEIMKCMRYNRLIVFPIFYHVDPSDVRKHEGTFAEAFDKHDGDPAVDAKEKQTWRDALTTVANCSGWLLGDCGNETTVVEQITRRIFSELYLRFSIKSGELVGIEARVEEMMKLVGIGSDDESDSELQEQFGEKGRKRSGSRSEPTLSEQHPRCPSSVGPGRDPLLSLPLSPNCLCNSDCSHSNCKGSRSGLDEQDVRFIGIYGMSGVGKTTLAKIIFDRVARYFEVFKFIALISEGAKIFGLASLRNQLISEDMTTISNVHVGTNVIVDRLRNRQALIVLDDVDSKEQLEALAGSHDWFGPKSRIIFTSRDRGLLEEQYGAKMGLYEVKVLSEVQALQLFSLSALGTAHPTKYYEELSEPFTNYARGLPLALKVLGSSLSGKTIDAWKSARDRLQVNPSREIMDVLELGYFGLDDLQKKLFLDIAFFFEGELLDDLLEALESFGYYPKVNIYVLVNKSLITISEGRLRMHFLLQKMAQNIVHRESPEEPCHRSRLWDYKDILHVLESDIENDVIEGIALSLPIPGYVRSNAKAITKMKRLRILKMGSTIIV